jgi:geranylgeranyl pyrophosphate synthase
MRSEQIEKTLLHHLERTLPSHSVKEIYQYATLPGGKLFRPHLVWATLLDLNPDLFQSSREDMNSNHSKLASAVEFHHTYTLLHDDLPCMDNDLERRGKPCTHIAYNEWSALLTGDGLLNISYQLLAKINHQRSHHLLRFFSWALGPKGLIHGQVMDLSNEMTLSLENTIRTHELKTARLIQVAILGSALIARPSKNTAQEKALWKYARHLGINFQLIDDLSELAEKELSEHELTVNPWLHFKKDCLERTLSGLREFEKLSHELKLSHTNLIVKTYYQKMLQIIEKDLTVINHHLKGEVDLVPVILLMKSFSNL